ncbi:MAG: methionine synthase [Chloroflexi bacterium]|nr:methionine synthase [Chloroflexota bacterium]
MTKQRIYTNRRYLDAIADHVLIFDGAMGTEVQRRKLTADDFGGEQYNGCNDYLVITRPDVIESIHASYFAAGSEVVETDTFRSNRHTLGEYHLQDRVLEINRAAASLARKVADRFEAETGIPRFVAGSIGPSGFLPSSDDPGLSAVTYDQLADIFGEQAQGLVEGGADVLLIETSQDILEVRAAVYGINRYFEQSGQRIPIQVQVTLDVSGRMLLGTEIGAALVILEGLPLDVIGLNCSTGPEHMRAPIKYLVENSAKPISVLPNAGLPINVDGEAVYPMLPEPFSDMMAEFVDWGVSVVGGCCGTTPEHITHLREAVTKGQPHRHASHREITTEPQVASAMRNVSLIQDPGPTLIGERVNSQGSRAVKKMLLNNDYDGILNVALDQVDGGAHILDIGVALTERPDEADQMRTLVKKLAMSVSAPLVIDTTEADVAEAALAVYPGRGIINSINLEDGLAKIERTVPIALKHGAAVIALTIDEVGMAHTADRKLEIATRIRDICVNDYGMKPGDLIFDVLTFPVTTGQEELRNDAKETIDGIRLVKEKLPGVLTSLGVSNVSFGISPAARAVLDSVFLYQCLQAGLDMAIVNPKHIKPYAEIPEDQRQLANDLIFNRHIDALPNYIQYFEENQIALESGAVADPTEGMTAEQALHWHIVHRKKDRVEELIDESLTRQSAVGVLNNVLLPAMKEVGDKFGSGELILPFVLQSAEVMKKAVAYLENFLERKEGSTKGTVILATVYGDVHDIGKNLVRTILSNNGYTVHDIGKQVPANTIIQAAIDYKADAIGLSALLVSTSKQMPLIVNELAKRNLNFPVLIGGAAINRRFGRRILFLEDGGEPYQPGVFYCKDAFEGLDVMDKLTDPGQRKHFLEQTISEGYEELGRARPEVASAASGKSNVPPAPDIPTPPFWGTRTISSIPLENVFPHLHKPELYRLSWGAKNTQGKEWEKLQVDFEERLAWMQQEAIRKGTLKPQAVYGYFPAQSDGDSLIIYDPKAWESNGDTIEIARFNFPRQPNGDFLCLSDYYASVESGIVDVCPLQIVTAGQPASEHFDKLQNSDQYTEAYYFHGLAVQTAEATATFVNQHINRELGIPAKRGKRYSWGYPACPDLDDHQIVFQLLPEATQKIGMSLTSAFQLLPEQSTAAIFVHHPEAKYYSVGVSRVEQLVNA